MLRLLSNDWWWKSLVQCGTINDRRHYNCDHCCAITAGTSRGPLVEHEGVNLWLYWKDPQIDLLLMQKLLLYDRAFSCFSAQGLIRYSLIRVKFVVGETMLCKISFVYSYQIQCYNNWHFFVFFFERHVSNIMCKIPALPYANLRRKTPLEIHFIYSSNKEIYCIFNMCCIISGVYSTKCHLFHDFVFFCSNNTHVSLKPCAKI
jgi:hypothetical protein